MRALFRFFAERQTLANVITFLVIFLGLSALTVIQRDNFPSVDFDEMTITTRYPGASPEDVELKEVDGIVVAENIWRYRELGYAPLEAAVEGTHSVFRPVLTTILTTALAFAPMFFMSGIMGAFVFVIPLVVVLALTVSFIEITWAFLGVYLKPFSQRQRNADQIVEDLRTRISALDGITRVNFIVESGGPPVGRPITLRVVGSDDGMRERLASLVAEKLGDMDGVKDIDRNTNGARTRLKSIWTTSVSPTSGSASPTSPRVFASLTTPISSPRYATATRTWIFRSSSKRVPEPRRQCWESSLSPTRKTASSRWKR